MHDFLIITCVQHAQNGDKYYAYGPYVREMNLWIEQEGSVAVVAPLISGTTPGKIDLAYDHSQLHFVSVPAYHVQSVGAIFKALVNLPGILFQIARSMKNSKHIHIRTPGNMGLLAMFVQIFFPNKPKTIKYAGNWDGASSQPKTYKIQRYIANNTFLTRNAKVLVYGEWPDSSANVVPFFTASYLEREKEDVVKPPMADQVKLVFIGALYDGKNPEIGIQLAKLLKEAGVPFELVYCGDGVMREELEMQTKEYGLEEQVVFLGNVSSEKVKEVVKQSHFLIFVSETEGWPKAVAESMFWGCVPFTSRVSCVPQMVGEQGERGVLVSKDPTEIFDKLQKLIADQREYQRMSNDGMSWAREYTLEKFQNEINKLK